MRLSRYALPGAAASRHPCAKHFTPGKRALTQQRFESSAASHDIKLPLVRSRSSSLSSSAPFRVLQPTQHNQPESSFQSSESHQTIRQPRLRRLNLSPCTPLSSLRSRMIYPPDLSNNSTSHHQVIWRRRVGPSHHEPQSFLRFPNPHPPEHDLSSLRYRIIRRKQLTPSTLPPSSRISPVHGVRDRTSSPGLPIARINKSSDASTKLELAVPIAGLSQNVVTAFDATKIDRDGQTLSIAIDTAKNGSHTRYVTQRKRGRLPDTSGKIETDTSKIFKEWLATLRRLDHMTAIPSSSWTEITVTGMKWHLLELYHYVLSMFPRSAFSSYPVITLGRGSMTVSGEKESLQKIQLRYLELQKEADESAEMFAEKPNTWFNSERGTRAVAGNGDASIEYVLNDMQYPPENQDPSFQSKARFSKYIKSVTELWKPKMLTMDHPNKTDWMASWKEDVVHRLLFQSDFTRPFVSYVALHQGLTYLIGKRKSLNGLRFIAEMTNIGFPPNAEFFNTILLQYAKWRDFTAVNNVLDEMNRRGIVPNPGTWSALLSGAPTTQGGREIAYLMYQRNSIKQSALSARDAPHIISFSFGSFLDDGGTTEAYLSVLDQLFGPDWSSSETNRALLNILGERLMIVEGIAVARRLIDRKISASANPAPVCLQTLLIHCNRQTNADLAVWLTMFAYQEWKVQDEADPIVLDLLFHVAWRSRMYNLLRVVWRYAIANAQAGHLMRHIVLDSLWTTANETNETTETTVRGRWRASFGAVVCRHDPRVSLDPPTILDKERRSLMRHKPAKPFVSMIAQALAQDKAWAAQRLNKSTSIEWKIENVIRVPFMRKWTAQQKSKALVRKYTPVDDS